MSQPQEEGGVASALSGADWRLEKESELRVEVTGQDSVELQLMTGNAEVFGTELAKGKPYPLPSRSKVAVFTWYGCTIRIAGSPEVSYVSHDTPMVMYLNTHMVLEQFRRKAEAEGTMGPKVLVAGAVDVGKSTLCKMLLNYAVRMGRKPCLVDIDVGQGSVSIPGTVGMLPIERPADLEEGEFSREAALVLHFGHASPGPNIKLYCTLVTTLTKLYEQRCQANHDAKTSGCIINSCGWVDGAGYKVLLHAARAFEVDVVLVVDHERLYNMLQKDLPPDTHIVPLPKSGGVVVRSSEFRKSSRVERMKEYFYGKKGPNSLFPFSIKLPFSEVKIFKIGAPAVPDSALPLGMEREDGSTQLVPVEPTRDLVHHILSLSSATTLDSNLVTSTSVGFLCVSEVDLEQQNLLVLSPGPQPLPRKYFLLSQVQFMDLR